MAWCLDIETILSILHPSELYKLSDITLYVVVYTRWLMSTF